VHLHPPIFVALSVVIACLGSWTALDLFRRVHAHTGSWRGGWLTAAAVAMGLSIWAMHFVAMLGFNPGGGDIRYDVPLTLLSLLLAIAVTAFAFFAAAERGRQYLIIGGVVMGAGICVMHYVGMAALITPVTLRNEPLHVVLSFLVAVLASTGSLLVARRERTFAQRAAAAVVLGAAIVGMHFTAIAGVRVIDGAAASDFAPSGIDSIALAIAVTSGTLLILMLALIAALSDRRFEALAASEASRSEQQLRAIFEHLPLGVFVAETPSGQIRFSNAEAQKLLDQPLTEGGLWAQELEPTVDVSGGQRAAADEHVFHTAMRESRRVGPQLQTHRRRDGSVVQLEVTAAPIRTHAARASLAVVALQDVTEKVAAEGRVAAALAEKADAEAALLHAQRLESLGRLTGGVAHDFNNLLTVVIGALDIILRHPESHERRKRLGEAALAAAKRGERLTAQLLAFARRQPLQPVNCDLNELVKECEPLMRGVAHEKLELELRLGDMDAVALIDPTQFEALLLNLIVNAVDATPPGGRVTLQTSVQVLRANEIPGLAAGRYFQLAVSDTGQGMSQEVMSRIFEPFYTTKPPGKGTGLGLSQVYGFVRQSGGDVRVHSMPDQGTRFTVCLPIVDEHAAAPALAPIAQEGDERSLRVLLAEDDASVATITETMLKNLGHDVTRVENGEQALRVMHSEEPFDLLMSDVIMPGGLNGVEVAREAVALRPALKVLLCSGYAGESIDRAIAAGSWPFLRKPYLQDDLAAHLQRFFEPPDNKQQIAG
jgi:PAS domain S-box-containing protein